jgi:TolB-like protein
LEEGAGLDRATGAASAVPEVFISYASEDSAVATTLVEELERHEISCWIAPRDVKPGALYADAIVRAISAARIFILVLSKNSIASSHVGKEIERASSKRRPIIAVRIDTEQLTPALEYFLGESQWVDVSHGNLEAAYARLIGAIREPAAAPRGPVGSASAQSPRLRGRRFALAAGIGVLVLGLAALISDRLWLARRGTAERATVPAEKKVADKSVAVLPFVDLSEKKDQEYFADGIAEEVLDRLARVPGLRVIGRVSSFQFKGKGADSAAIGTALKVGYLLEGGVRREAGRISVTARLVEAQSGSQRWSGHFDADVTDVLRVQDTIAAEISRALQIAVQADATSRSAVTSAPALDAYLRGLQAADRSTQESTEAAVADYEQALTIDPTFAPAAIELARNYAFIASEGWMPPRIANEKAREAALLAERLDPKSPVPHTTLAVIHIVYDWDWPGAERELQLAFALGPRTSEFLNTAQLLAAARGEWALARQLDVEAAALDPLNPDVPMFLGWTVHMRTGQYIEAEQSIRSGLQIAPEWGTGRYMLGEALLLQGHPDQALGAFQKETMDDGQLEGSAMAQYALGHKKESDAFLAKAITHNGTSWAMGIAHVYAFRGEKDRALEWLERAYDTKDEDMYLVKDDPLLKNLAADPRYKAILKKMNLPE